MQTSTDHFMALDGTRLFEQIWRPNHEPKAVMAIVHGYTEHSGRYRHLAQIAMNKGIAVEAFDLRGHGRSSGSRGFVRDFRHYVSDLSQFLLRVRKRNTNQPVFLFGHSMGGTIAIQLIINEPILAHGLILSGAALTVGGSVSPTMQCVITTLSRWFPKLPTVSIGNGSVITQNPTAIKDYDQDPLVYRGRVPARTGAEVIQAIQSVQKQMENMLTPLLILHGTADRVTDPEGSRQLYARARSTDKTFKPYNGLSHSLLEESDRDLVLNDIFSWIAQRMSTHPVYDNTATIPHR